MSHPSDGARPPFAQLVAAQLSPAVPARFRVALVAAADAWRLLLGDRLVSLVLFGSVARGQAGEHSDIDLVVVAEQFPRSLSSRRQPLIAEWQRIRQQQTLAEVEWNLVTKTPDEARHHSPLYLDIVDDGVLLFDRDGFFRAILQTMRARMQALGSRRVYLPDGSHYWDLKPDFRFGGSSKYDDFANGPAVHREARGRVELVRLAHERCLWATVIRAAQEAIELFLKGALRIVAVEPSRTHDVAELLRREALRFPDWFGSQVEHLASISTEMAGDRGIAFYGDERQRLGPQELFDHADADRALSHLEFVSALVLRLLDVSPQES